MISIIIPCHNEENYIGACLQALLKQQHLPSRHNIQVIVVANACTDQTVPRVNSLKTVFLEKHFQLCLIELLQPGKISAIEKGESESSYDKRLYLDADVIVSEGLIEELIRVLDSENAVYASGTIEIPASNSVASRAYAKIWQNLPFVLNDVPGIGLYALNKTARARWGSFPKVYSDDRFVRLNFQPEERRKLKSTYQWPLPDGFWNLLKVRERWSRGNFELQMEFPELIKHDPLRTDKLQTMVAFLKFPLSAIIFLTIYSIGTGLALKNRSKDSFIWQRGRS